MSTKGKKKRAYDIIECENAIYLIGPIQDSQLENVWTGSNEDFEDILSRYFLRPKSIYCNKILIFVKNTNHKYLFSEKDYTFFEFYTPQEEPKIYFIEESISIDSLPISWEKFSDVIINLDHVMNYQTSVYKSILEKVNGVIITNNNEYSDCKKVEPKNFFWLYEHLTKSISFYPAKKVWNNFTNLIEVISTNFISDLEDTFSHNYNKIILRCQEDYIIDIHFLKNYNDLVSVIDNIPWQYTSEIIQKSTLPTYYRGYQNLSDTDKYLFWESLRECKKRIIVKTTNVDQVNPHPNTIKTFSIPSFLELGEKKVNVLLFYLKSFNIISDSELLRLSKFTGFDKIIEHCTSYKSLETAVEKLSTYLNRFRHRCPIENIEFDILFWYELYDNIKNYEDSLAEIPINKSEEKPKTNISISFDPISKIFHTNSSRMVDQLALNSDILTLICLIKCYQNGYPNGVPPETLEMLFMQYEASKQNTTVSFSSIKELNDIYGLDKRIRQRIKPPKKDPAKPQREHKKKISPNFLKYRRFTENFDLECGADKIMFKNFSEFQFTIEDPDFNDDWINTLK